MNAIFHGTAVLAALLFSWWLLRTRRDRELLREMIASLGRERRGEGAIVRVDEPAHFLTRLAQALGVPFVDHGQTGGRKTRGREAGPVRVSSASVLELHLLCWIHEIKEIQVGGDQGRVSSAVVSPGNSPPGKGAHPAGGSPRFVFVVQTTAPLTAAPDLRDRLARALGAAHVEILAAESKQDGRTQARNTQGERLSNDCPQKREM